MTHQTIQQSEDEGIRVLKDAFKKYGLDKIDIEATPTSCSFDAIINDDIICEIKGRNLRHDQYKTYFLERKKHMALQEILERGDNDFRASLYFCYFRNSNKALAWWLREDHIQNYDVTRRTVRAKSAKDVSTAYQDRRDFILLPAAHARKLPYDRSLLS